VVCALSIASSGHFREGSRKCPVLLLGDGF
jgi:hypothetical protein